MPYRESDAQSLEDLAPEERVVLLHLARELVAADGATDRGEGEELGALRRALGADSFDEALAAAVGEASAGLSFQEVIFKVERLGAREVIYGALFELAIPGTIHPDELELLEWLREAWGFERG